MGEKEALHLLGQSIVGLLEKSGVFGASIVLVNHHGVAECVDYLPKANQPIDNALAMSMLRAAQSQLVTQACGLQVQGLAQQIQGAKSKLNG